MMVNGYKEIIRSLRWECPLIQLAVKMGETVPTVDVSVAHTSGSAHQVKGIVLLYTGT